MMGAMSDAGTDQPLATAAVLTRAVECGRVLSTLRAHGGELRRRGLARLRLLGSVAREIEIVTPPDKMFSWVKARVERDAVWVFLWRPTTRGPGSRTSSTLLSGLSG
jgi:hypothetical protein